MNGVSVVILTKNDAARILKTVDSVQWANEIIAVDDCSSDATPELLGKRGVRIITRKMETHDFAAQRNAGMDAAAFPWVLHMDSDEIVPPALADEIRAAISRPGDTTAFEILRDNYFLGRSLKCDSDVYYTKLFRKDAGRYEGVIHEAPLVRGPLARLRNPMEHHNFDSVHQYIQRQDAYTETEARVILEKQGILRKKDIEFQLRKRPFQLFCKYYVKKGGWKDGIYGLAFAALKACRHIMLYAKYCELVKDKIA